VSSLPPIGITPQGFRDDEIGTLSAQAIPEPGAYRFAESLNPTESQNAYVRRQFLLGTTRV